MFRKTLLLTLCLTLFGAGCASMSTQTQSPDLSIPMLKVMSPANGTVVEGTVTIITGQTDRPYVALNGTNYPSENGLFTINTRLVPGNNEFELAAGNGLTTTTERLNIVRTSSTSSYDKP